LFKKRFKLFFFLKMDLFHRSFPFGRWYSAAHVLGGGRLRDLAILMLANAEIGPLSLIGCISAGCHTTGSTRNKWGAC
jgi:hypothetical protein